VQCVGVCLGATELPSRCCVVVLLPCLQDPHAVPFGPASELQPHQAHSGSGRHSLTPWSLQLDTTSTSSTVSTLSCHVLTVRASSGGDGSAVKGRGSQLIQLLTVSVGWWPQWLTHHDSSCCWGFSSLWR